MSYLIPISSFDMLITSTFHHYRVGVCGVEIRQHDFESFVSSHDVTIIKDVKFFPKNVELISSPEIKLLKNGLNNQIEDLITELFKCCSEENKERVAQFDKSGVLTTYTFDEIDRNDILGFDFSLTELLKQRTLLSLKFLIIHLKDNFEFVISSDNLWCNKNGRIFETGRRSILIESFNTIKSSYSLSFKEVIRMAIDGYDLVNIDGSLPNSFINILNYKIRECRSIKSVKDLEK